MAAIIRSTRNATPSTDLEGVSRDDLISGDVITLASVDAATSYLWTLMFTPEDVDDVPSSATFLPPEGSTSSTARFIVDNQGAYLIRLIVDQGLPTQDTQIVRLRSITIFGTLKLVAAGERRDQFGVVPSDADAEGWANDQNSNLLRMEQFISRAASSGRVLYVDANRGTDNNNVQNDLDIAAGYGDYSKINVAIAAALTATVPPSEDDPYLILIRPGRYIEDLSIQPWIFLQSTASQPRTQGSLIVDRTVYVDAENLGGTGSHNLTSVSSSDFASVTGLYLDNTGTGHTTPTLSISGPGSFLLSDSVVDQSSTDASAGSSLLVDLGSQVEVQRTHVLMSSPSASPVLLVDGDLTFLEMFRGSIQGPLAVDINPGASTICSAHFDGCRIISTSVDTVNGYGVRTVGSFCHVERSTVTVETGVTEIRVNPLQEVKGGDTRLRVSYSETSAVEFDTTNLAVTSFQLEATQVSTLTVLPSVASLSLGYIEALASGKSVDYDPTVSGLVSRNVQGAIDEIAAINTTAIRTDVSAEFLTVDNKLVPTGADLLLIEDSGDGFAKKNITVSTLIAAGGGVSGPIPTTIDAIVRWDNLLGTLVENSTWTISDAGVMQMQNDSFLLPPADNQGEIGSDVLRWRKIRAAEIETGDLVMREPKRQASWRFVEYRDFIAVLNETTGQKYRLALIPDGDVPESDI